MNEEKEFICTTIEEALKKKQDLEKAILELCTKFEQETRLRICEVQYFKTEHGLTEAETKHVNISVKL